MKPTLALLLVTAACTATPGTPHDGGLPRAATALAKSDASARPLPYGPQKPEAATPRSPAPESAAGRANADPAPPAAPAYDLAADLDARRVLARSELGAKAETELVEGVFLIATPSGKGALSGAIDVTRRSLAAYFNGRFSKRPTRAISVYLFPNATRYHAYCQKLWNERCDSPYGFYLGSERKIVMNVGPGIGTLTHELVHPLVEADFPNAPDWINEGIASLFEQFHLPRPGEIHGGKNWRHPRLISALGSKTDREHATLPALFAMTDEEFRGKREDLNYATARYLCQWLDGQGLLWPFYQRWRDDFASDPSGEKAFAAVVGTTPEEANPKWQRWVRAL